MKKFILVFALSLFNLSLFLSQTCESCVMCIKSGGGNGCLPRCPSSCASDPCAKCLIVYKGGSACKDTPECKSSSNKIANVPYFYQYNNQENPGGTCQITTMAMSLSFYGVKVTPDYLYNQFSYSDAKDPSGWAYWFNKIAERNEVSVSAQGLTTGSYADVQNQIEKGYPVPVFGYFTSGGHVMLVVGFTDNTVICNDPAGKWSQEFKYGGYSEQNPTEGKYVEYDKTAFKYAVYGEPGCSDTTEAEFWYIKFSK